MPETIRIPKKEYKRLTTIADRFDLMRQFLTDDFFVESSIKDVKQTIKEFRATGLYNEEFLESLERGLRESAHLSRQR